METAAESERGCEEKVVRSCVRLDRWNDWRYASGVSVGGDGRCELFSGTALEIAVVVGTKRRSDVVSCEGYGRLSQKWF